MQRWARLITTVSLALMAVGALADGSRLAAIAEAADRRDASAAVWAEALASRELTEQLQAVRGLGRIGGDAVLPRLLPLLAHDAAAVRQEAAFALAIAGFEAEALVTAEQALLTRLAAEPEAAVRAVLLRALGNVGAEPSQSRLRDYLQTAVQHSPEERAAWAQAAGFLWSYRRGALTAVDPALVQQLLRWTTVDQPVAEMAAFALARARKEAVIPLQAAALRAAFGNSPSASARVFLLRALSTSIAADSAFWLKVQHSRRLAGRTLSSAEAIELQTQLAANLTGQPLRSAVASALRQASAAERWAALQSLGSRPADLEPLRDVLQAHAALTPADRDWLAPLLQAPAGAAPDASDNPEASEPPAPTSAYADALTAVGKRFRLQTVRGSIDIELLPDAVYSAANFARLAERGYYNGTVWHRVIGNFVAQGGDPTGTGEGGPGWRIREELSPLPHAPGYVGMATAGKDTAGSQFFINTGRNPHLDWHYTVFARLLNGQDVALQLLPGDRVLAVTRLP